MGKKRNFGELEAAIITVIAKKPHSAVSDVVAALGSKDSYTAIMTVMNRLVVKKELSRRLDGKRYIYDVKTKTPLIERLKARFLGGSAMAVISHLLSEEKLSYEELEELERMIQKKRHER